MSNKVKRKTPLKKTKLAKTFDYEEKLGIPNPYDKGKFGVKGNKKLLNVKTRKKYEKVKDLLRVLDLEADLGKKEKFDKGGSKKNKKEEISKKIDKMMGFPMEKIDELIKQAKDLNKPKKRFDKGGSNMAKKNFSSKELIMKNPTGEKPKTFKEAFAAARKKLGPGKVFTFKGKKYTTDLASEKKKSKKSKNFSSKSLITEKSVKSGIPKKKTNFSSKSLITKKSIQSGVPKTKKKILTQNPFKNPTPPVVATKSKTTTVAQNPFKNPNPPIKKMNKGGVFKGIF